ncbi:MAG: glutamine--fructose-6-phosphate transaminase (isomerizing) [Candidatus Micrarchaeia archaeon]
MCGIIGILKTESSKNTLNQMITSLKKMDYRGYDSWGYATINGKIKITKRVGRISPGVLEEDTFIGIGHTRWATHGAVTDENAHPHTDCKKEIAIAHNGIIENYLQLKEWLQKRGHKFLSDTDTEVIAHLFEEESGNLFERAKKISMKIEGSFAIVAMDSKNPNEMVAIKNESPLLIGTSNDSLIVASDPLAFIDHTKEMYVLLDGEIAYLKRNEKLEIEFYNYKENKKISKKTEKIHWDHKESELMGHPHFMLKEILEQPNSLRNGMNEKQAEKISEFIKDKKVVAVACGTARHASVIGKHILYRIAKFNIEVMMAHEYSYFIEDAPKDAVILAVSQSGETADVLEVVRKAKKRGIPVISIVNIPTSTLARESKLVYPINCGPEIAVASTKAFSGQILAFYLIAYAMAGELKTAREKILRLISLIEKKMEYNVSKTKEIAHKIYSKNHVYVLGKGVNYAIALEGALKIKEISYIHAEGMPSGELKHGTLALIENGTPVILLSPTDYTYNDCISNGLETKARGAYLIGISDKDHPSFDDWIDIGQAEDRLFYPLLEIIPLQLLAYYTAVILGRDVDKPRNLAKSVTVK